MNSLAMTDSLLLVVTFLIAIGAKYPPSIRIAAGLFAAAACLGVLRFTGVLPLPTMHSFFSGLGATAAYPLLAVTFLFSGFRAYQSMAFLEYLRRYCRRTWPRGKRARVWSLGECGRAYLGSRARLAIDYFSRRIGNSWRGVAACTAVVLFALNVSFASLLKPGDFLHLFMALGLGLLGLRARVKVAQTV